MEKIHVWNWNLHVLQSKAKKNCLLIVFFLCCFKSYWTYTKTVTFNFPLFSSIYVSLCEWVFRFHTTHETRVIETLMTPFMVGDEPAIKTRLHFYLSNNFLSWCFLCLHYALMCRNHTLYSHPGTTLPDCSYALEVVTLGMRPVGSLASIINGQAMPVQVRPSLPPMLSLNATQALICCLNDKLLKLPVVVLFSIKTIENLTDFITSSRNGLVIFEEMFWLKKLLIVCGTSPLG